MIIMLAYKQCSRCRKNLLVTEYYKNKSKADNLDDMCRQCRKEYMEAYRDQKRYAFLDDWEMNE